MTGLTGRGDMRDVEQLAENGDENAQLALDIYHHRIVGYVGNYWAQLGGLDAITFTAGVGENSAETRAAVIDKFAFAGVKLDAEKNAIRSDEPRVISAADSSVAVCVVPTNEELAIARKVIKISEEGDVYGNKVA